MKKILATLLVATMLLSCFAVIGYAAGGVGVVAPVFSDETVKSGKYYILSDALTAAYYDTITELEDYDTMLTTSPLYKALDDQDLSTITLDTYKYDVGEYIAFPISGADEGIFALNATLSYPDTLELVKVVAVDEKWSDASVIANKNVIGYAGENVTGVATIALFKVVATTGGSATIKATITEATYKSEGAAANCAIGATELTFALNGAAAELPEATTDKLTAAVEFTGEVTADSFAQIPASQIVSGDSVVYDYNTHGDYRIFFGKFVDATYKQPTAQGFVIEGGKETVKAAAKTEFKAGEPFGILVFGMGAQTKLTATPFIEY